MQWGEVVFSMKTRSSVNDVSLIPHFVLSDASPPAHNSGRPFALEASLKDLDWLLFDLDSSPSKSDTSPAELHNPAHSPIRGMRAGV